MNKKTPLELADEHVEKLWGDGGTEFERMTCEQDFLAGYEAAKREEKEQWDAAHERMVAEYETNSSKNSDSSEGPDLQEQVEALHQYMTVAQRKIMALQANVEFLFYHNKEKMGESEAIRRMQQTMQGFGRKDE
jgi:hypothetical protein